MKRIIGAGIGLLLIFTACDVGVNRDIRVSDGTTRNRGARSVNGNVRVGSDCRVRGECMSVNGSIEVGERSMVRGIRTVNGSVSLGAGSQVKREVQMINGSLDMEPGAEVERGVKAINGPVHLDSAVVRGGVVTFNSDIYLNHGSRIEGDIRVRQTKDSHRDTERRQVIEITGGSVVEGNIRVYKDQQVDVILTDGGRVTGKILNANLIQK
jgi:hypothetical protein